MLQHDVENMMLSERRKPKKETCMIPLPIGTLVLEEVMEVT